MATAQSPMCPWCDAPFDGFDCHRCEYTPSLRFRVPLRAIYTLLLLVFVMGFAIGIQF